MEVRYDTVVPTVRTARGVELGSDWSLPIIDEKCMEVWTKPNSYIICITILMWAWP